MGSICSGLNLQYGLSDRRPAIMIRTRFAPSPTGFLHIGVMRLNEKRSETQPQQGYDRNARQGDPRRHRIVSAHLHEIGRLGQLLFEFIRRYSPAIQPALADLAAGILHQIGHGLGFHALRNDLQAKFPAQ